MYSIEITSEIDPWFAQPDVWDSLSQGIPFRQAAWLGSWWKHLSESREAYLVVARDAEGNVQGLLPLYRAGSGTRGRTLRYIGDGNACTDDITVLSTPAHSAAVAEAIGRHLAQVAAHHDYGWDLLDLDGIVEGDTACRALALGLTRGGASLHSQSRMNTWYRSCEGTWEAKLKEFSSKYRRTLVTQQKKMDKTPELSFVMTSDDELDNALERLIQMHQARWNAAGEPGTYAAAEFRDFISAAVHSFRADGKLWLPTLRYENYVIAAELHLVGDNQRTYCYSSGYDVEYSKHEPGRLLNLEIMRYVHESDWVGVDMMRGDEPYKQRMDAEARKLIRLRAVAPAFVPRLCHVAWRTQFELKQWFRQKTGRKLIDVVELVDSQS